MIGALPEGRGVARAAALSLAIHAAAGGWLVLRPTLEFLRPAPAPPAPIAVEVAPRLQATPVAVPSRTLSSVALPPPEQVPISAVTPAVPLPALDVPAAAPAAQVPAEMAAPTEAGRAAEAAAPVAAPQAALSDLARPAAPAEPAGPVPPASDTQLALTDPRLLRPVPAAPETAPAGGGPVPPPAGLAPAGSAPTRPTTAGSAPSATAPSFAAAPPPLPPELATLIDRIRAELTQPCLLALPRSGAGAGLELQLLADHDRGLAALAGALTGGLPVVVGRDAGLLDPRQCPAVAFARRDPLYPVPALDLRLDSADLPGGATLGGAIRGAGGLATTLLLIDDNGVVHDLRPFVTVSAAEARFAVPMIRSGPPRDTRQLLVAIATPARPAAVARHAGELAAPFFAALAAEIGTGARIGVASVTLR